MKKAQGETAEQGFGQIWGQEYDKSKTLEYKSKKCKHTNGHSSNFHSCDRVDKYKKGQVDTT